MAHPSHPKRHHHKQKHHKQKHHKTRSTSQNTANSGNTPTENPTYNALPAIKFLLISTSNSPILKPFS